MERMGKMKLSKNRVDIQNVYLQALQSWLEMDSSFLAELIIIQSIMAFNTNEMK